MNQVVNIENKPNKWLHFSPIYFCAFVLILAIEVIIALYINDKIIRPYGGDVLVVILIYCFVKAFIKAPSLHIAIGTLLFAYTIEIAQYFNFVELLHLHKYKLARIVLGTSFSWGDIISYTIGALICILIDKEKKDDTTT